MNNIDNNNYNLQFTQLYLITFSLVASAAASGTSSGTHDPGPLEQSQSQRRLRGTSPRWKEHYAKLSQQWSSGTLFVNHWGLNYCLIVILFCMGSCY